MRRDEFTRRVAVVVGERDRAREIAAHLEEALAEAEAELVVARDELIHEGLRVDFAHELSGVHLGMLVRVEVDQETVVEDRLVSVSHEVLSDGRCLTVLEFRRLQVRVSVGSAASARVLDEEQVMWPVEEVVS